MRILVLDDDDGSAPQVGPINSNRHEGFIKALANDNDVTLVTLASEACKLLKDEPKYDALYLDHDLELDSGNRLGGPYGSSWDNGLHVTKFICNKLDGDKVPDKIIVHSHNESGAQDMLEEFSSHGIRATYEKYNF